MKKSFSFTKTKLKFTTTEKWSLSQEIVTTCIVVTMVENVFVSQTIQQYLKVKFCLKSTSALTLNWLLWEPDSLQCWICDNIIFEKRQPDTRLPTNNLQQNKTEVYLYNSLDT